jgi:HlyD family secretion protein
MTATSHTDSKPAASTSLDHTTNNTPSPTAMDASPKHKSRKLPLILIALFAIVGGGLGFFFLEGKNSSEGKASAEGGSEKSGEAGADSDVGKTAVQYVYPQKGGIERVTDQPGSVHAFQFADLEANTVSGYWQEKEVPGHPGEYIDIGSKVKKGDLLGEILYPPLEKQAEQARAVVKQREAQIDQAKALIQTAKANLDASKALVKQYEAAVERAVANHKFRDIQYERILKLWQSGSVDRRYVDEEQAHLDESIADENTVKAQVVHGKAEVSAAEAKVLDAEANLMTAKAELDVARADLGRLEELVKYLKIISPYDGVVTVRNFHSGDFIRSATTSGTKPLFTVTRTDVMRVIVMVPDRDVPYCDIGDPTDLRIDALAGRIFKGKVARIADSENAESRTMRIEIDIVNTDGALRDGMYGQALIHLAPPSGDIHVPSGAIQVDDNKKNFVYVVRDGKAVKVPVTVGNDSGIDAEIVSGKGLSMKDKVVLSYNGSIGDGVPVLAEEANIKKPAGH